MHSGPPICHLSSCSVGGGGGEGRVPRHQRLPFPEKERTPRTEL